MNKREKMLIRQAKRVALNNIHFYTSSARRGAEYFGFEVMVKMLPNELLETAIESLKVELRTIPRPYYFLICIFSIVDGNATATTYEAQHPNLTIVDLDLWITETVEECIHDVGGDTTGYGMFGTPNHELDLEKKEPEILAYFENVGCYDKEKGLNVIHQYKLELMRF